MGQTEDLKEKKGSEKEVVQEEQIDRSAEQIENSTPGMAALAALFLKSSHSVTGLPEELLRNTAEFIGNSTINDLIGGDENRPELIRHLPEFKKTDTEDVNEIRTKEPELLENSRIAEASWTVGTDDTNDLILYGMGDDGRA